MSVLGLIEEPFGPYPEDKILQNVLNKLELRAVYMTAKHDATG